MSKNNFFKVLKHFSLLTVITWIIIGASISFMFNPVSKYTYKDTDWDDFNFTPNYNHTKWNILLDSHSHTFYSDGYLSSRQNLLWHISMGFNAMVLSDHNSFEGIEEIKQIARNEYNDSIKVLTGMEWTTDRLHMNIILPSNITAETYEELIWFTSYTYTPTDQEIQDFIDAVHELEGIVILNHYPWSQEYTRNHPTRQQLYDWGIDYFEIVNEEAYDNDSYVFCQVNDLGIIAGTDMHQAEPVFAWTSLNVSEYTEEAIFLELKARRTDIIFTGIPSPYPIVHPISAKYLAFFPLIMVGEMFESMYSSGMLGTQLGIFFAYIYGIFIVVEILIISLKSLIKKLRERVKKGDNESF